MIEKLLDLVARERFEITRAWTKDHYLTRWTLCGKRFGESKTTERPVFLHHFHRSDADEMHDHPWPFVSVILGGGYYEKTPAKGWSNGDGPTRLRWYGPGRILIRPANWIHSVIIPPGHKAWSLVFVGKKAKSWGFYCPLIGYRPWREHLARAEKTGNGCGE